MQGSEYRLSEGFLSMVTIAIEQKLAPVLKPKPYGNYHSCSGQRSDPVHIVSTCNPEKTLKQILIKFKSFSILLTKVECGE